MSTHLKCPWPYFGGKSRIARLIWDRLGNVDNYIEAFCGSAAVLLARPHPPRIETVNDPSRDFSNFWRATHPEHGDPAAVADTVCEVINDADPYVANAWRSIQADPEETVSWADHPVDECYLHAVHRWLVLGEEAEAFRERMRADPDFYDPKRAGRWIFGICCWIGGGWCSTPERNKIPRAHGDYGTMPGVHAQGDVSEKRPRISGPGQGTKYGDGVHAKGHGDGGRPQLADAYSLGRGVHAGPAGWEQVPRIGTGAHGGSGQVGVHAGPAGWQQMPKLQSHERRGGDGVHNENLPAEYAAGPAGWDLRPIIANSGGGGHGVCADGPPSRTGTCEQRRQWLLDWFGRLRDRLRNVRVCCGDWTRVCSSESVTTRLGLCGIYLDPPYSEESKRAKGLYAQDSLTVAHDVKRWCLEAGRNPQMRIVLSGYAEEGHEELEQRGWECIAWESGGGYGNRTEQGKANAKKERLWVSPACVRERSLFDGLTEESASVGFDR